MNITINAHLQAVEEMTVEVDRSTIDRQGLMTWLELGDVRIHAYGGDGSSPYYTVSPGAFAARLRELADEIDVATAALEAAESPAEEAS